ncbi:hypothetical protein L1049_002917 [Liquidambar formosana]|uniref:NAC domain-containing protein n=1 Tax=Liquidambar formosana TaxID=63359 RepID=A0AAP0NL56_LIQFO
MEKPNFVSNGDLKLPIGFRFHPTDEELVVHYLKRKALSLPLPASVIPEFDVFQTEPWGLPGDLKERRYYFSKRKGNWSRCKRPTGSGYWKVVGKDKQIVASGSNQAVGRKKTMVFYEGKRPHASRTRWVIHEYCLGGSGTTPISTQESMVEMEDWVVYRVFQKKRKTKDTEVIGPNCIDFMMEQYSSDSGPPQPSSSGSSGITEVSSNESDQEESSA